ncbi:MAG TPA: substrate-binding domain-containing protein [Clostridiaceae bacterium]|nr:substrate-binding domain-containing protein [Clostridiaceae bacterium]
MSIKKMIALLLVIVMTFALAACGSKDKESDDEKADDVKTDDVKSDDEKADDKKADEEPADEEPADEEPADETPDEVKKTIYVLAPNPDHGWTGAIGVFAEAKVDELNNEGKYDVRFQTFASADDQIKQIEDIIANDPGDGSIGVAMLPASPDVENAIQQLADANIPYTAADRIIPSVADTAVSNIKYDNVEIGAAAASYLVANGMVEGDKVVCIEGDGSSADTDRTDGFNKYLKGEVEYDGKKIDNPWSSLDSVTYSGATGWNPANAQAFFETYMSVADNADTKYIAAWDSGLAIAVFEALNGSAIDESIKESFLAEAPYITGCGGPKAIYEIIAGDYSAYPVAEEFGGIMDVTYPPAMIQDTIQALVDHFEGKPVPQENTQSAQCVTADNVADFMDQGFE